MKLYFFVFTLSISLSVVIVCREKTGRNVDCHVMSVQGLSLSSPKDNS